ncbi:serine/arginine-rich splicing factor 7-like isoform X1 [Asparagus officinalis]|uniref:serine/arginine-rich splicing factor 7-like isoform X1 n=2 Tax=Asparagus officinalis TaxID=4686 RepID=UPI00098E5BA4|nr:serine/arginine-rich splicing factor 7-like isoform X1 [Asparagus officinalis]XP_020244876.1 serine/arginine-rich splicing factor 7-like isoform X1 [Asparagus officinalis]
MKPWPSPINHLPSSFSDRFSKGGGKIQSSGMWKIYVGNLSSRIRERELAEAFNSFGLVRSVWVARNPPGYAFIEFNSRREADNAISALDGKHGWRVEMSKRSSGFHKSRSSSSESRCRECGSVRHRTKDCRSGAAKRSYRRSSSPHTRTGTDRHIFPGRQKRSRSPRHGNSNNDRCDLPRKRERSISSEPVCIGFSQNDQENSHADQSDVLKQHEGNTSPEQYHRRSPNDEDGSADECNVLKKRESRSPEDYPSKSPQNGQGTSQVDDRDAPRQHDHNTSPESYRSRSQTDQDSSEDECNVPRKRERKRSPEQYPDRSESDRDISHADEKRENNISPVHESSISPEPDVGTSPQNNQDGSCADELSPENVEHFSSRSPLRDSSPEY